MEWLVNWINPMIIFVGVPLVTALTRQVQRLYHDDHRLAGLRRCPRSCSAAART